MVVQNIAFQTMEKYYLFPICFRQHMAERYIPDRISMRKREMLIHPVHIVNLNNAFVISLGTLIRNRLYDEIVIDILQRCAAPSRFFIELLLKWPYSDSSLSAYETHIMY